MLSARIFLQFAIKEIKSMKVTKTSTQHTFQPINLTITIESKEEYQAIKEMASCYIGCPKAMVDSGQLDHDHQDKVETLFFALHEAIRR